MDTIFGTEFPLLLKFVISFAVVLILIGAAAFVFRRFGPRTLARASSRSPQPRLAVVDIAPIDDRRNLVIVRRDNVEHLLLIGGPTDLLVEPNISQTAVQPAREPDSLSRPAAPPAQKLEPKLEPRPELPLREEPAILPEPIRPEPAVRIQPVPAFEPTGTGPVAETAAPVDVVTPPFEHALATRARTAAMSPGGRSPNLAAVPPPVSPAQDFDVARERMNGAQASHAAPEVIPSPPPAPKPEPVVAESPFNEDQNLADMAQRLEAALRRPLAGNALRATPPHVAQQLPAAPVRQAAEPAPPAAPVVAPPVSIAPSQPKPPSAPQPVAPVFPPPPVRDEAATYETLQREMASLLGRKPGSS